MKLKNSLVCLLALALTTACGEKMTETPEGDRYIIHKSGGEKSLNEGDMLSMNLKITSSLDSVFTDSWTSGKAIDIPVRKGQFEGSFENALLLLHEGDSATVLVSADSLFTRLGQPFPAGVPASSDLKFVVKIESVKTAEEFEKALTERRTGEADIIEEYVKENLPDAVRLESGMYYLTEKEGNGAAVSNGDLVRVSYVGKFFDGNIFDQNTTFEFPVGRGMVIKGWDVALQTMKVGQKTTFVIPSDLAYGERGAGGNIPPFSPLVFDIELFEIK